jgi:hypothetical protein
LLFFSVAVLLLVGDGMGEWMDGLNNFALVVLVF